MKLKNRRGKSSEKIKKQKNECIEFLIKVNDRASYSIVA